MVPGDAPDEPSYKKLKLSSSEPGIDSREFATQREEKTDFVHKNQSLTVSKRKTCTFVLKGNLSYSKIL